MESYLSQPGSVAYYELWGILSLSKYMSVKLDTTHKLLDKIINAFKSENPDKHGTLAIFQ